MLCLDGRVTEFPLCTVKTIVLKKSWMNGFLRQKRKNEQGTSCQPCHLLWMNTVCRSYGLLMVMLSVYLLQTRYNTKARFRHQTFNEPNLIRIKANTNYLDRLNWFTCRSYSNTMQILCNIAFYRVNMEKSVRLRKPWACEIFQECWSCIYQSQERSWQMSRPQNQKLSNCCQVSHWLALFLEDNNIPEIFLSYDLLFHSNYRRVNN